MNDFYEPVKDRKSFLNKNITIIQIFVSMLSPLPSRFNKNISSLEIPGLFYTNENPEKKLQN
jgi:hypothetical protein